MEAAADVTRERDRMWWLVIGGAIAIVASTIALWAWLPEPIASRWEWGGPPNDSFPKVGWMLIWSGAWALASSSLVALRAPLDWRRWLMVVVSGVLLAGHIAMLENNLGAGSWHQAEPLDTATALILVVLCTGIVWLAVRRLESTSDR